MEPVSHRQDREAIRADRSAVATRVRLEVERGLEVAAEKRIAFFERFIDHLRVEFELELEREWLERGHLPLLALLPIAERAAPREAVFTGNSLSEGAEVGRQRHSACAGDSRHGSPPRL